MCVLAHAHMSTGETGFEQENQVHTQVQGKQIMDKKNL